MFVLKKSEAENKSVRNRKQRRNTGIFFRSFMLLTSASSITILFFAFLTIPRQHDAILKSIEAQAESVSASIAQVCGNAIMSEDYAFIVEHNLEVVQNSADILYVIVARHDGFSLLHTKKGWEQKNLNEESWGFNLSEADGGTISYSDIAQEKVFEFFMPLEYSGFRWGLLVMGISLDRLNSEKSLIYTRMLYLSLCCLGIGMTLAYVFARRLTRPILSLVDATKKIAQGDMNAKASVSSGDEIEELAVSFNNMTENLKKTTVSKNYMDNIISGMNDLLIVTDMQLNIKLINEAVQRMLGYSEDELKSKPLLTLFNFSPESDRSAETLRSLCSERPQEEFGFKNLEAEMILKDGKIIPVLASSTAMKSKSDVHTGIILVAVDISERKKAEEKIRASLTEKEVLLKEIHHRVKNNLQVISSLLYLQSKNTKDLEALNQLQESRHRVRSMALIHEKLYRSKDLVKIDFNDYLKNLLSSLFNSYKSNKAKINLKIDVDNIFLNIHTAIPCGLIVNEIVSNSLKHAFPNGNEGNIMISLKRKSSEMIELTAADDGIGLPDDIDVEKFNSLGMKLIHMFTEQLSGELRINGNQGAQYCIAFQEKNRRGK